MNRNIDDVPKLVVLFFPKGFNGQKFHEFETKDLYYEGVLERLKTIRVYMDEAGWQHCYVVSLSDTHEDLKKDFRKEKREFQNNFESIKSKFVILYFPDKKRGKMFDHFDIKDLNYRGPFAEGVWFEILDVKYGWRHCFVISIYDSLEEMIIQYAKVTEKFAKDLEDSENLLKMKDTNGISTSSSKSGNSIGSSESASTSSVGSSLDKYRGTDDDLIQIEKKFSCANRNLFGIIASTIDEDHKYNKSLDAKAGTSTVEQLVPFTNSTESEIINTFLQKTRR